MFRKRRLKKQAKELNEELRIANEAGDTGRMFALSDHAVVLMMDMRNAGLDPDEFLTEELSIPMS